MALRLRGRRHEFLVADFSFVDVSSLPSGLSDSFGRNMVWYIRLWRDFSSVFVTVGTGHSPLAEKHLHITLAMEAREGPTIQDKGECLMEEVSR